METSGPDASALTETSPTTELIGHRHAGRKPHAVAPYPDKPSILYFGTLVVLVVTSNEDGSANIQTHAHADVVIAGTRHIDPSRWNPLFYVFRHYFGQAIDLGRNFRSEV